MTNVLANFSITSTPPDMHRLLREKQEVQTIKDIAKKIQEADTLKQIREHMLKLSQHMEKAPVEFTEGNDILKMNFDKDVSAALEKTLRTVSSYRDMFVGASLLEGTAHFLKSKIAQRLTLPGESSWTRTMIDDIVSILPSIPIGMIQQNPNFLKTVAKLPNSHVLRMGAGIWFSIHHLTAAITNEQEHNFACRVIERFQDFFPCKICKEHFGSYLQNEETSPNSFKFVMKPIGKDGAGIDIAVPSLFLWSIVFHNNVNGFRIDYTRDVNDSTDEPEKVHFDLDSAYRQYFVDKEPACASTCH
jgi:hypothetical protein